MVRGSVKVCVRARPTQNFAHDSLLLDEEQNLITVVTEEQETTAPSSTKQNLLRFTFNRVFYNSSQQSVYDAYPRDVVQGILAGYNGTIFSYGQTGAGKTFTMMGDTQHYEHRGIAPRAIAHLYSEMNARLEIDFEVRCTYLEIYNEKIYDLLADSSGRAEGGDFMIVEEKQGKGTHVRGVREEPANSETECLNLLYRGDLARTTAHHKLNRRSNRSHSIFSVYVQQKPRTGTRDRVTHSKLHLVDLAGSERLKKSLEQPGIPMDDVLKKESMYINQSLTYLEQCVVALNRRSAGHIPFRQSKLTNLLKDALGGNCNTVMVACIWGEATHLEETMSTLRFAQRMMKVQNEARPVETMNVQQVVKNQENQIRALKQEILMHDAMANRSGVEYDPYTPEQSRAVRHMIERYLQTEDEHEAEQVLDIQSYRQMLEICKQFKLLFKQHAAKRPSTAGSSASGLAIKASARSHANEQFLESLPDEEQGQYVGELDPRQTGFSLGIAPDDARPPFIESPKRSPIRSSNSPTRGSPSKLDQEGKQHDQRSPERRSYDEPTSFQAFEVFKMNAGKQTHDAFVAAKLRLKHLKSNLKDTASRLNGTKEELDCLTEEREKYRATRTLGSTSNSKFEDEDVIDEEEFKMFRELRDLRRSYRDTLEELKQLRQAIEETMKEVETKRVQLLQEFQQSQERLGGDETKSGAPEHDFTAELDDQEMFDRLAHERIMQQDPDSLAFYQAQKARLASKSQSATALRQLQRTKRRL